MKITYKAPEITVEELTNVDVLLTSGENKDNKLGNYSGSGGVGSGQGFDFDTGNLLKP